MIASVFVVGIAHFLAELTMCSSSMYDLLGQEGLGAYCQLFLACIALGHDYKLSTE